VTNTGNTAVTWSLSPVVGSITAAGLYTAPASIASSQTVTVKATSVADPTKSATATVTLNPPVSVTVTPASATLTQSQTQSFSATVTNTGNTAVTWSLSPVVGSITAAGLYTAPASIASSQTVTVTATSVADPTKSVTASVTLTPPVTVSLTPSSVSLLPSKSQTFTATVSGTSNTAVTWSINPASTSLVSGATTAVYVAPSTAPTTQSGTLIATSMADPSKTATALITLLQAITVSISPSTVSLAPSGTQQFTATVLATSNTAVTWSINPSVGTISSTGLYTAPSSILTSQTVTVNATSVADSTQSASAIMVLVPADTNLALGKTYVVDCPYPDVLWAQYQESYPDPGFRKLTDGQSSPTDWGFYVGYLYGDRRIITIDLGADSTIHRISADFLQVNGAAVFFPGSVTFYLSSDSINWAQVGTVLSAVPPSALDTIQQSFELGDLNFVGRYLRVEVPVDVWVFMDEIQAWGWPGVFGTRPPAAPIVPSAPLGYPQPGIGSGNAHHQVLVYNGYTSTQVTQWTKEDFKPYVTYVDAGGVSRDTLYDSFLFLPVATAQSGRVYNSGANPSNQQDWISYLDQTFDASDQLAALDSAVATARQDLGVCPNARVVIAIPFPSPLQSDFDGSGDNFNHLQVGTTAGLANRSAAVNWYIDQVISRWQAASFQNINLVGFYWYIEGVMNDLSPIEEQVVENAAAYIHAKGYQFSWIPGNDCAGFRKSKLFGFDVVNMQPNYMFEAVPADRLHQTAALAQQYGLGVEMEMDDGILQPDSVGATDRAKLLAYLDYGVTDQYMVSFVAWYQQVKTLSSASSSINPDVRQMYDLVYQFVKGRYVHSTATSYP
jgi:hypothetical protein